MAVFLEKVLCTLTTHKGTLFFLYLYSFLHLYFFIFVKYF